MIEDGDDIEAMSKMRESFRALHNTGSKARKARAKSIQKSVDGRSLRSTGRTEQSNTRVTPQFKAQIRQAASVAGISIAEWLEQAVAEKLGRGA